MTRTWRDWLYSEWNSRVSDYCFRRRADERYVERIPATPEELVEIVGDSEANPDDVVARFVEAVRRNKGDRSFEGFCRADASWTPSSSQTPKFVAALWLTCLIAYGYPQKAGGAFHDRATAALGVSNSFSCLPDLWKDLRDWTRNQLDIVELHLPPYDSYRSNIGHSWFLAFPHMADRTKLRALLREADLIGDEPPVEPLVRLIRDNESEFSSFFRADLDGFVSRFLEGDEDLKQSAFWRAVRQECLDEEEVGGGLTSRRRRSDSSMALVAEMLEDDFDVFVACREETVLPDGYSAERMPSDIEDFSHYVSVGEDVESEVSQNRVVLDATQGALEVPLVRTHFRRGVLIFRGDTLTNEFVLSGGAEANEATVALVRGDRREAFLAAYGGTTREYFLEGWYLVEGCRVSIRYHNPDGLEDVHHLRRTMIEPRPRLVGGIPTKDGYFAFPGQLPRIRFQDAETVLIENQDGEILGQAERWWNSEDEWKIPQNLVERPPCALRSTIVWRDGGGAVRNSMLEIRLLDDTSDHTYKHLNSGSYIVEGCSPGERKVSGGSDIDLEIVSYDRGSSRPDRSPVEASAENLDAEGCEPNYLAQRVVDALSAIATRKGKISRHMLFYLFRACFGMRTEENPRLYHDLVRGLVDSTAVDLGLVQHWKGVVVACRIPRFVVTHWDDGVRAHLTGLVPSHLREEVMRWSEPSGFVVEEVMPGNPWQPSAIRVRGGSVEDLARLSSRCGLEEPVWFDMDLLVDPSGAVDVYADSQRLRHTPVPEVFDLVQQWDWNLGDFIDEEDFPHGKYPKLGIRTQRRVHETLSSAYVVVWDGGEECWTYIRNWALLFAQYLDYEGRGIFSPPFDVGLDGVVYRPNEAYIYLPKVIGHACTLMGEVLPGARMDQEDETRVVGYAYPFGRSVLSDERLVAWMDRLDCIGGLDLFGGKPRNDSE